MDDLDRLRADLATARERARAMGADASNAISETERRTADWAETRPEWGLAGNGGDLMTGLPLQSLLAAADRPHHQPLCLSTVVHAPVERVTDALADHEDVIELLDNDWLSLAVVDPTRDHRTFHYEAELAWTQATERTADAPNTPAVADD
ncbi:Uncharacterized protein HSR121_2594 [Halapricum desulfuricans]|uniref:Uncharacterized protein n=1 Tax=Halapricum desulfuricans TaxID=2841257 RepID=A0A897N2M9_9EURY|nr:Uncharacterized protein HSR121_2594 [Halapricum desulfuricans]